MQCLCDFILKSFLKCTKSFRLARQGDVPGIGSRRTLGFLRGRAGVRQPGDVAGPRFGGPGGWFADGAQQVHAQGRGAPRGPCRRPRRARPHQIRDHHIPRPPRQDAEGLTALSYN